MSGDQDQPAKQLQLPMAERREKFFRYTLLFRLAGIGVGLWATTKFLWPMLMTAMLGHGLPYGAAFFLAILTCFAAIYIAVEGCKFIGGSIDTLRYNRDLTKFSKEGAPRPLSSEHPTSLQPQAASAATGPGGAPSSSTTPKSPPQQLHSWSINFLSAKTYPVILPQELRQDSSIYFS